MKVSTSAVGLEPIIGGGDKMMEGKNGKNGRGRGESVSGEDRWNGLDEDSDGSLWGRRRS